MLALTRKCQPHRPPPPAADAEGDEDLYGDLESAPLAKKSKTLLRPSPSAPQSNRQGGATDGIGEEGQAPLNLHGIGRVYDEAHVAGLQKQMQILKEENESLKRNMGTLYRTAKAELKRKDERITRLQDQVDTMASSGAGMAMLRDAP